MQELDTLLQEVIDFGNVIANADDPTDINLQHACHLFSDYLNWKIEEFKENLKIHGSTLEIQLTVNELTKFSNLLEQTEQSPSTQTHWLSSLLQQCADIQQGKIAAA
ncbi:MAG: hypothetical protein OEY61_05040 [Gammaproteobacteria bacterium]|nr:hypothetical protein [Gammaproteobacteria bacterium]